MGDNEKNISTQTILENADLFLATVQNFKKLSNDLMLELAQHLNIPIQKVSSELIYSGEISERRDVLGKEWSYFFHGKECRFRNLTTGQIVDMRLDDYENEEAIPDPFFLSQFVHSTPSENHISNLIKDDFNDMNRALKTLKENGYFE